MICYVDRECFLKIFDTSHRVIENCKGCPDDCPEGSFVQLDSTTTVRIFAVAEIEIFGVPLEIERCEMIIFFVAFETSFDICIYILRSFTKKVHSKAFQQVAAIGLLLGR